MYTIDSLNTSKSENIMDWKHTAATVVRLGCNVHVLWLF